MDNKKKLKTILVTGLNNCWIAELIIRIKEINEVDFQNVIYWKRQQTAREKLIKNIKKHGIIYIPWRAIKFFQEFLINPLYNVAESFVLYPSKDKDLNSTCSELGISLYKTSDIHSEEGINFIQSLKCDVMVVCGTGILKKSIFELPAFGTINLHQGEVPKYRGAPPGFWELWNNEKCAGVTVHFINEGIDTGDIILQKLVPIFEYDNLSTTERKLSEISLSIMPEAIKQIATGTNKRIKQPNSVGQLYMLPTIWQRLRLNLRFLRRRYDFWWSIRNVIKRVIFLAGLTAIHLRDYFLWRRGKRILSVLYYHRVTNICQDGMTVGLEDFERQIRFLKKHYNILHPAELYGWLHGRDGAKGEKAVLITFDDGYEDNYLNALPILKKYDCPAIFFISTGLIGNDVQFGHEKQIQPNLEFKKMTWEQLKDATQYNIEIGVHSDTHANLGQISFEEAVGEIERSIQKCEYYLGRKPTIMSYPFGGKENISLKVIDYIKHGGVITNLFSAYGNKNISPFNDFDIKRINVGSNDNKQWIFRFNLEGGFRTIFYPRESL